MTKKFTCRACDGELVKVGIMADRRSIFRCKQCHDGEYIECPLCNIPRSVWALYASVCAQCALEDTEENREISEAKQGALKQLALLHRIEF
ncbi:MAG: hypothetical protein Q8P20_10595 [bacterium]|nr:hypothetical protein [bacterium]